MATGHNMVISIININRSLMLTLVWPVSAHQLGGGFDRLWRCKWSWCGPCIYLGSKQLQDTKTANKKHFIPHGCVKCTVCSHPWHLCCWGVAMGMERVEKAERGQPGAARCWSQGRWRWRARLVSLKLRRWADSESIAPLVLPPQSHPMDKPGERRTAHRFN